MATTLDIIKGALRKINQYAPGETIDNDDAADALEQLNGMLDIWSTEHLTVYNNVETVFTLSAGKQSYTVGSGGEVNMTRPLRITGAYTRLTQGNSSIDYPCTEVAFDQYAAIGLKSQPGPWPKAMYFNSGYPLSTLTFWPVPSSGYEFHLWTDMLFTNVTLATQLSMPPGYLLGLQTNLACLLAPEYGVEPSRELKEQASMFKRLLKDVNAKPQAQASYDGALTHRNGSDAGWFLHGGFN